MVNLFAVKKQIISMTCILYHKVRWQLTQNIQMENKNKVHMPCQHYGKCTLI